MDAEGHHAAKNAAGQIPPSQLSSLQTCTLQELYTDNHGKLSRYGPMSVQRADQVQLQDISRVFCSISASQKISLLEVVLPGSKEDALYVFVGP